MPNVAPASLSIEARTGLDPWGKGELPAPPDTSGLKILKVVGPGAIVLGASIGSGEWLLGPAVFVRHGLSLLWVTLVAAFFQALFNTELVRYTLYTGEPAVTGFMRTRPRSHVLGLVLRGPLPAAERLAGAGREPRRGRSSSWRSAARRGPTSRVPCTSRRSPCSAPACCCCSSAASASSTCSSG